MLPSQHVASTSTLHHVLNSRVINQSGSTRAHVSVPNFCQIVKDEPPQSIKRKRYMTKHPKGDINNTAAPKTRTPVSMENVCSLF